MLLVGVAVATILWQLALTAGAGDTLMQYLYFPIGIVAVFVCGLAGKFSIRFLSQL